MPECVVRMEMPHDGLCDLAFSFLDRTCCTIEGNLCNYCDDGVIPKWCPIICSLPEEHGRLVDADKLKAKKYHSNITHENAVAVAEIDWAETIVQAERSEK